MFVRTKTHPPVKGKQGDDGEGNFPGHMGFKHLGDARAF